MILNHGYKGQVMDIYNDNDITDKNTLYYELITSDPKEITLITIDNGRKIKIKKSDDKNFRQVIEGLKTIKETLVKKFIYINYLFGSKKNNFNNELKGYKSLIKIFKDKIDIHTTIKEGFKFNGRKIYGIIFNDDYYIFLERCFKNLEEVKFTTTTLNKCITEIMETLNILNGNDYIHNDLKPNNIILCKNRFKIIDWDSSNDIKHQSKTIIDTRNGNIVFNHPLKFYNVGVPYFMYDYIYDIDFINYKFLVNKKKPLILKDKIEESFDKVVEKYEYLKKKRAHRMRKGTKEMSVNEIQENKNYFLKLYDYWSFALTIIYLSEINKVNYNKKLINPILNKFFIKL